MHFADRPATAKQTFGFARTEILAALLNGGLLFAVTVLIGLEAIKRFAAPEAPEGPLMAGVAAAGLTVNVVLGLSLMRGAHGNLNVRAAFMHVVGDALASAGVVVGGLVIWKFGILWLDPALSLVVGAVIIWGVVGIVKDATGVLLESAPAHADVDTVAARIRAVDGVVDVHDLHVWTIGTGSYALAGHVLLPDRRISDATKILRVIDRAMRDDFRIGHVTVQFECESCSDDERVICTQRSL